ncbi:hypothetical protein H4S08_001082 [Coemansia sp. RSA 1365]|nr:hypothetical protein H4S08_001082 [Coemansia sp. RSA 1365]
MDLTSSFRKLVQQASSKQHTQLTKSEKISKERPDIFPPKRIDFTHPTKNAFLSEAYIIAKHLHSLQQRIIDIRPTYLCLPQTARHKRSGQRGERFRTKLSDPERDELDRSIKAAVCEVLAKIQSLSELGEYLLESVESNEGAKELFHRLVGALDPRKATGKGGDGGTVQLTTKLSKRDAVAALQSSVVWWLNARLRSTNQIHAEMQEQYLRQKLERQRSLLQQQKKERNNVTQFSDLETKQRSEEDEVLQSLSEQQLQQLRSENETMVEEFESALDRIRDTQRSVAEISALQSQLATELNSQMQQTERLYNEAVGAVDAVEKGNEHLISARKHQSSTRKWVLFIFIMLSLVLLFLDWFD